MGAGRDISTHVTAPSVDIGPQRPYRPQPVTVHGPEHDPVGELVLALWNRLKRRKWVFGVFVLCGLAGSLWGMREYTRFVRVEALVAIQPYRHGQSMLDETVAASRAALSGQTYAAEINGLAFARRLSIALGEEQIDASPDDLLAMVQAAFILPDTIRIRAKHEGAATALKIANAAAGRFVESQRESATAELTERAKRYEIAVKQAQKEYADAQSEVAEFLQQDAILSLKREIHEGIVIINLFEQDRTRVQALADAERQRLTYMNRTFGAFVREMAASQDPEVRKLTRELADLSAAARAKQTAGKIGKEELGKIEEAVRALEARLLSSIKGEAKPPLTPEAADAVAAKMLIQRGAEAVGDGRVFELADPEAKLAIDVAQKRMEYSKAQRREAQAVAERARRDFERVTRLLKEGVESEATHTRVQAEHQRAQAAVEAAAAAVAVREAELTIAVRTEIIAAKRLAVQYDAQVAAWDAAIVAKREKLGALSAKQNEADMLHGEVQLKYERYRDLVASHDRAKISAEAAMGNALLIDEARPSKGLLNSAAIRWVICAVFSLAFAVSATCVVDLLDTSIRSPEDLMRASPLPSYGYVPRMGKGKELIAADPDRSATDHLVETFRNIFVSLEFAISGAESKSLVVTSAGPGEGKTTITANLAAVAAKMGRRVVVIDADLQSPRLSKLFKHQGVPGLADVLRTDCELSEAIQPTDLPGLSMIPAGHNTTQAVDLVRAQRIAALIAEIEGQADLILIDVPPLVFANAVSVASCAAQVLVVVEADRATPKSLAKATDTLRRCGKEANAAIVVNKARIKGEWFDYYHYGYYYYGYGSGQGRDADGEGKGKKGAGTEQPI